MRIAGLRRFARIARTFFRDGETTIKIKCALFEGGGPWGQRGKSSKNAVFRGKRHDNKILKVEILLSRYFVIIAQAPNYENGGGVGSANRFARSDRFARIAPVRVANRRAIQVLYVGVLPQENIKGEEAFPHAELPSDTKLLLTKNYFETIIFEKITNVTHNSSKKSFFPGDSEEAKTLKLRKIILGELFS